MRESLILIIFVLATGAYFYFLSGSDDPNRATDLVPSSVAGDDNRFETEYSEDHTRVLGNDFQVPQPDRSNQTAEDMSLSRKVINSETEDMSASREQDKKSASGLPDDREIFTGPLPEQNRLIEHTDSIPQISGDFPPDPAVPQNEFTPPVPYQEYHDESLSVGQPLPDTVLPNATVDRFVITINDISYDSSQTVFTSIPVRAWFNHPNPAVTNIRMEYPRNTSMYFDYPVNEEVRLQIHESHLQAGMLSHSDFIAQDDQGNSYGRIRIVFAP